MRTIKIWIPFTVLVVAVVVFALYPSRQERGERLEVEFRQALKDVSRIALKENGRNMGGEIVYEEIELTEPESIRAFTDLIDFSNRGPSCQCMYSRYIEFTTPERTYKMVLGPHHFWLSEKRFRSHLFVTPMPLYSEFESKFGRTYETKTGPNKAPIASLTTFRVD